MVLVESSGELCCIVQQKKQKPEKVCHIREKMFLNLGLDALYCCLILDEKGTCKAQHKQLIYNTSGGKEVRGQRGRKEMMVDILAASQLFCRT